MEKTWKRGFLYPSPCKTSLGGHFFPYGRVNEAYKPYHILTISITPQHINCFFSCWQLLIVDWNYNSKYLWLIICRFLLMKHNTSEPIFFGRKFKPYVDQGYFSGGAGYVLSREALKRFIQVKKINVSFAWNMFYLCED